MAGIRCLRTDISSHRYGGREKAAIFIELATTAVLTNFVRLIRTKNSNAILIKLERASAGQVIIWGAPEFRLVGRKKKKAALLISQRIKQVRRARAVQSATRVQS